MQQSNCKVKIRLAKIKKNIKLSAKNNSTLPRSLKMKFQILPCYMHHSENEIPSLEPEQLEVKKLRISSAEDTLSCLIHIRSTYIELPNYLDHLVNTPNCL